MEEEEMIDCREGKNKGVELVCRIARGMQEKNVNVAFSEMEDALVSIDTLSSQIKDVDDLKSVIRPAMAKSGVASKVSPEVFDNALRDTFATKKKVSEKSVSKELE